MNIIAREHMDIEPKDIGSLLGLGGTAAVSGWLLLRRWLSSDRVSRTGDQAQIDTIQRLTDLLDDERKARKEAEVRADIFAKERNDAIQQIGELKGQITALTLKVELLTAEVKRYADKA